MLIKKEKCNTSCCCLLDNDVNIYEGDIDLSPDDIVDIRDSGDVDGGQISARRKRNAARNRRKLWVTRVVPYVYDVSLPGNQRTTTVDYHIFQTSLIASMNTPE